MAELGGDVGRVNNLDDNDGAVSFNIDVNGDAFGSTHNGTVTCAGPVRIVSEQRLDGGGHYSGETNGDIYTWHTQCGAFAGVHYNIQLAYSAMNAPADRLFSPEQFVSQNLRRHSHKFVPGYLAELKMVGPEIWSSDHGRFCRARRSSTHIYA